MTSRYHGSKISGSQQRGVFATATANSKKAIGLDWQKKKKTITLFCTFLSQALLHDCDMKLPNFMRPLYGVGEHNTKIFFFFFSLRYGSFQPRKFRQHLTN